MLIKHYKIVIKYNQLILFKFDSKYLKYCLISSFKDSHLLYIYTINNYSFFFNVFSGV